MEYLEYQLIIIWKVAKDIKEIFKAVNVETMQSNTTVFGDFNGSIIKSLPPNLKTIFVCENKQQ